MIYIRKKKFTTEISHLSKEQHFSPEVISNRLKCPIDFSNLDSPYVGRSSKIYF